LDVLIANGILLGLNIYVMNPNLRADMVFMEFYIIGKFITFLDVKYIINKGKKGHA
jgi:hypothetical protein